jgi:hypothetical protein
MSKSKLVSPEFFLSCAIVTLLRLLQGDPGQVVVWLHLAHEAAETCIRVKEEHVVE